ncbi:MAG: pantoate--beta-alanine ligase [Planctomycetes bacterium]|nr:pantoate--beta-alanine ligase [Planctomycetota bacterium]MCB9887318.1 pantoate--beta-alanine ligase [Planctomycetota bacterium]
MREITVHLGLGSNQGDRQTILRGALERLGAVPGVRVVRVSTLRESELVGQGPPQGAFLNGVAELCTSLSAAALLDVCKALEVAAGRRVPAPRNHPRPLDLDILTYGTQRIDSRQLVVPHPRWRERAFVTEPLQELGVDLDLLATLTAPVVIDDPAALAARTAAWLEGGCVIGLVPTMGALHAGHQSLVQRARQECDRVLLTVFVNPLQFGPNEDFAAYPRDLARDVELAQQAGADAVFAPSVGQMYDASFASHVGVGAEAEGMEGAVRPGHFGGVATVVARLLAMSRPHVAYFGEKDAQQLAVIRRMVRDLGFPLRLVGCPIVREADGLAMSSRNVYLGPEDRVASTVLHRALLSARHAFARGERDRDALLARVRTVLASEPRAAVDYVELRREGDLALLPAGEVAGGRVLVAARFTAGARPVRLIDNMSLLPGPEEL